MWEDGVSCGCWVFYKHVAPLGLWWFVSSLVNWIDEAYTLRSSGARRSEVLAFYRHIAPLERKVKCLMGGVTPPLRECWIYNNWALLTFGC